MKPAAHSRTSPCPSVASVRPCVSVEGMAEGIGEEEDMSSLWNRHRGRWRELDRRLALVVGARAPGFATGRGAEARADCANAR